MDISTVALQLKSWSQFRTPYLSVSNDILGLSHTYFYFGKKVTITLPGSPIDGPDGTADRRLRLSSWKEVGGQKIPISYAIHSVDVSVEIEGGSQWPAELLRRNPNATDLLTKEQVDFLTRSTEECQEIALNAFEFWVRILRWQTELHLIGRDDPDEPGTGWATYLLDAKTEKKVWVGSHRLTIQTFPELSKDDWARVQEVLLRDGRIPISVDLYFDSLYHLHVGDLRRAISDAAVAAESHVREVVQEAIPSAAGAELRRLVDEANIRPVIQRVYGEACSLLGDGRHIKVPSEIHELFDFRNKILHKGTVEGLTKEKCKKLIVAVRSLLWGEL